MIVVAVRPLTVREMSIAYATDEQHVSGESVVSFSELDLDLEENFRYRVRNLCGLFVSVVNDKKYLIHQTAKEFLISHSVNGGTDVDRSLSARSWEHSLDFTRSNIRLLSICLTNLLFQHFEDDCLGGRAAIGQGDPGDPNSEIDRFRRINFDPTVQGEVKALILTKPEAGFLEYAAEQWSYHFHAASDAISNELLERILKICDIRTEIFSMWYWIQLKTHLLQNLLRCCLHFFSWHLSALTKSLFYCSTGRASRSMLKTLAVVRYCIVVRRPDDWSY